MTQRPAHVIAELQSFGLRFPQNALKRTGGAGPAEAGTLIIGGFTINVPTDSPYVARSPYALKTRGDKIFLYKKNVEILPVQTVPRPRFYNEKTADGISCQKIALLHGKDCLATSVLQTCAFWHTPNRCRFCGIELSLSKGNTIAQKTPEQLAETVLKGKYLDGIRHVVLTTGTAAPPGGEFSILAKSAENIKRQTMLPVHAQFMPPRNPEKLRQLKDAGVDTVGIHIESFHGETLKKIAPIKAALGLSRFRESWEKAVQLFGPGQVSSFLLVGLGETPESIISGSALLAEMGVYPFVVPLRPIPGSHMADFLPPDPETMRRIYEFVARTLSEKGLSHRQSLAGCVRCGACSALPAYEQPFKTIVCHPARTAEEREKAFLIRKAVFVLEQGLFKKTDQDEHDDRAVHLVAKQKGRLIGTVRVYPAPTGNGDWIGGRLAVQKGFRTSGAGECLVREAVAFVKKKGCGHFTAHIQEKNIPFFEQLGWWAIGTKEIYHGKPHQLMAADLEKEKNDAGE